MKIAHKIKNPTFPGGKWDKNGTKTGQNGTNPILYNN